MIINTSIVKFPIFKRRISVLLDILCCLILMLASLGVGGVATVGAQGDPSALEGLTEDVRAGLVELEIGTIRFCYEPTLSSAEREALRPSSSSETDYNKNLARKWVSDGSKRLAELIVKDSSLNSDLFRCIAGAEPAVANSIKSIIASTDLGAEGEDGAGFTGSGACEVGDGEEVEQGKAIQCIFDRIAEVVFFLSLLIGVALLGSTIFAGIQYITAGADSGKVQKAKGRLASNIIVLVLFLFSASILNWILPGA